MPGAAASISNIKMVLRQFRSAERLHCNSKFDRPQPKRVSQWCDHWTDGGLPHPMKHHSTGGVPFVTKSEIGCFRRLRQFTRPGMLDVANDSLTALIDLNSFDANDL